MPSEISGNLTATITYDADKAYGIGKGEYYLPVMNDGDWALRYNDYSFWNGKGYLRLAGYSQGVAKIDIMTDQNNVFSQIELKEGETSNLMYFPGFYCMAGLKVQLNKVVAPEQQARLIIDGNSVWVREGSKIMDGSCSVSNLAVLSDGTGGMMISCPGQKFLLSLQKFGSSFSVGDIVKRNYRVGEQLGVGYFSDESISNNKETGWYMAYSGKLPKNIKDNSEKEFAFLVGNDKGLGDSDLMGYATNLQKEFDIFSKSQKLSSLDDFQKSLGKSGFSSVRVKILVKDVSYKLFDSNKVSTTIVFNGLNQNLVDKDYTSVEPLVNSYFDSGVSSVNSLISTFSSEQSGMKERYGEIALAEQIRIAGILGKDKTRATLLQTFIDTYPSSVMANQKRAELISLNYFSFDNAYKSVFVNNVYHTVMVDSFKSVDAGAKKTTVSVGMQYFNDVEQGSLLNISSTQYFVVDDIQPNYVKLVYYTRNSNTNTRSTTGDYTSSAYTINLQDSVSIDKRNVVVRKIDVNEVAYVSVIPEVKNSQTRAPFGFKIGVEKRAIQIGPEKTQQVIDNLNKTIAQWQNIVDKMGTVITAWK
ncbi:MAG: hypothetical protein WCP89_04425, partial [archaeon]